MPSVRASPRSSTCRLADLWRELFEIPQERWDVDLIGWFLRTAYGQGYCDALQEGERGALCREVAEADRSRPVAR